MMLARFAFLTMMSGLVTARIRQDGSGSCPELEADWQDKLDLLLSKLPAKITGVTFQENDTEFNETLPGLLLVSDNLVGLDSLAPDRPYQTFCAEDTRIIIFTLRSTSPIRYYMPWKLCSGQSGNISTVLSSALFEGRISVSKNETATETKFTTITPLLLDPIHVELVGLGDRVSKIVTLVDQLFVRVTKSLWMSLLNTMIRKKLAETAEKESIQFGQTNPV